MFKKRDKPPVRRRLATDDEVTTYVRSRTIVDTVAHERGELKSERRREHELRARRKKLGAAFVIVLVTLLAGLALLTQFVGTITNVVTNLDGVNQIDQVRYKEIADDYFAHRPLERLTFAFRESSFNDFMKDSASEIRSANMVKDSFLAGSLSIEFRQPIAVWEVDGQKDYVDNEGVVFAQNYFAEPTISIIDNSGVSVDGNTITSRRFLRFVGQVVSGVETSGIGQVESVTIPVDAVRYVELRLIGRDYPIKTQVDRNPASQTNDIVNAVRHLDSNNIVPSYLDVRVTGKGFWK